MSEPKLISPMLDNFAIGGAISSHHGVSCYPAMENDFNDKYIVKVVSVPASQTQLDALLLTGAYSSLEAALSYFKDVADGVCQEVEILNKLSQLEGFLPYRACQCELKEDGSGYDVYLLSPYRRTLTRQFIRNPLTQLDVLNLGLDMCAALAVCRRSGYMYVDLKPNNIYITNEKGYYIGDLGFVRLDSLQYTSLPEKYHSEYTAPEIQDAFSSLNTTLDVYSLGLILYQAYNNGELPTAEDGTFTPPAYADYEMAEIIMKAISADPANRWQDPTQMGQALVSYMQRNGANDTPIVPAQSATEEGTPLPADASKTEVSQNTEEQPAAESSVMEELIPEVEEQVPAPKPEVICEPTSDIEEASSMQEDVSEEAAELETEIADEAQLSAEQILAELTDDDQYINLSFLDTDDLVMDEEVSYNDLSSELSDILTQADELMEHPVPEPVVAPEPIEVPMPEPIIVEEAPAEKESSEEDISADDLELGEQDGAEDASPAVSGDTEQADDIYAEPQKKRSHWLRGVIIVLIIAALLAGGYYYYQNYYLQTIDQVQVTGSEDKLTVAVDTTVDDALLYIECSDPHGNKITAPVADGKAEITGLLPNTAYSVSVQANGFHKLVGNTLATYSTPPQTNIVQFSAVTGSEDGSVILGFTVEGPDSDKWSVSYGADGEEAELASFPGHTVSLSGLTVGKEYTFTLIPETELYLTGAKQLKFTANKLVYAENLRIVSCMDGTLSAVWTAPSDAPVSSWTVRCNGDNYSESIVTEEPAAQFTGLDHTKSYTVEVIAAGMSVSQRAHVEAGSVTITNFQIDDSTPNRLLLTWDANAEIDPDGWILRATANGAEVYAPIICTNNSAILEDVIPDAQYSFTIESLNETDFLGVPVTYTSAPAVNFSSDYEGYEVTGEDISFRMCKTPDETNWNYYDVHDEDYRTAYAPGEKASFLMHFETQYGNSMDDITYTFVITDSNGIPVSVQSGTEVWNDMWYRYYGELDIPSLPSAAGEYTISTYFNGALVNTQQFTITE